MSKTSIRERRERRTLPQQRALETRGRILNAARNTFAARGYAAATIDDVATAAGVSKGALYHHFNSKEELFFGLLGHGDAPALSALADKAQEAKSFNEILTLVVQEWIAHYTRDRLFATLSLEFRLQATRDHKFGEAFARMTGALRSMLSGLIAAGQTDGAVPEDLNTEEAAAVLFGLLDGVSIEWCVDPHSLDPSSVVAGVAEAAQRVVGARASRRVESSKAFLLECAREVQAFAEPGTRVSGPKEDDDDT